MGCRYQLRTVHKKKILFACVVDETLAKVATLRASNRGTSTAFSASKVARYCACNYTAEAKSAKLYSWLTWKRRPCAEHQCRWWRTGTGGTIAAIIDDRATPDAAEKEMAIQNPKREPGSDNWQVRSSLARLLRAGTAVRQKYPSPQRSKRFFA